MAIDFKNIQFKYIKITGGSSTIDVTMDDAKFKANQPDGYYKCFTFQATIFGGNDYYDLKNLVDIEEKEFWNNINRTTLLGYNEESNEFIVNINAYMGLKDADLKTDGSISHPGQAGWTVMSLSTTKSANSIINMKQTDGSEIYLFPKPSKLISDKLGTAYAASSIAIDNKLKSILNATLVTKQDGETLWAKSPEDGSAIMVNNFVKTVTVSTDTNKLLRNNKEYGFFDSGSNHKYSTYKYGKKVFSFESSSSKNHVENSETGIMIAPQTSALEVELTNTSDLNDILSSGESLTLYMLPKAKMFDFIYNKTFNKPFINTQFFFDNLKFFNSVADTSKGDFLLSSNVDKNNEGIDCDLVSLDTRKPFIYESPIGDIKCNGIKTSSSFSQRYNIKQSDFKNIPDGFIFLVSLESNIFRYKKGDPVKSKTRTSSDIFVKISETTQFGSNLYRFYNEQVLAATSISKNDVINATGFTDVSADLSDTSTIKNSTALVTILKI